MSVVALQIHPGLINTTYSISEPHDPNKLRLILDQIRLDKLARSLRSLLSRIVLQRVGFHDLDEFVYGDQTWFLWAIANFDGSCGG